MKLRLISVALISLFILIGCGGGGDSSSNDPCSAVRKLNTRIAGGDSCNSTLSNVALLLTDNGDGTGAECTGSYISSTAILTAAHCVVSQPKSIVVASLNNIKNGVKYYVNPLYNGSVGSPFDMAIVMVDSSLVGSPLPLLISRSPALGESVVVYGYGTDENGKEAIARIKSGDAPLRAAFTTFEGYNLGTVIITSTGSGSTCEGDSGGPVVAKNSNGDYGIIGITRAGPSGCDAEAGRPSYLSSTDSQGALNFINSIVPDVSTN